MRYAIRHVSVQVFRIRSRLFRQHEGQVFGVALLGDDPLEVLCLGQSFGQVVAEGLGQEEVQKSGDDGAAAEHEHHDPGGPLGLKKIVCSSL